MAGRIEKNISMAYPGKGSDPEPEEGSARRPVV
jgi:hypothetical protein